MAWPGTAMQNILFSIISACAQKSFFFIGTIQVLLNSVITLAWSVT
jgi:hypothetical protein